MKRFFLSLLLILCISAELMIPVVAVEEELPPVETVTETAAPTEDEAPAVAPAKRSPQTYTTSEQGRAFVNELSGDSKSLSGAESAVNSFISKYGVSLSQQQFDALVDFVVGNIDVPNILDSNYKIQTVVASGNYTDLQIANAFCSWVKDSNGFSQSRLTRRLREIKLFLYGSYTGVTPASFRYVVFNGNGGKLSDNTVLCYTLNGTYASLPTATYDGCYFAGWYTAASGGKHLCNTDTVTQNYTVYAHWSSTAVSNPNEAGSENTTPVDPPTDEWPALPELKISEAGIQFIKNQEGFVASPIWDYGQYSVGYGSRYDPAHSPIKISTPITEKEADYLLRYMLKDFEAMVDKELAKGTVEHTQAQYDALISFAYNLGQQWINSSYETYRYILYGGYTEMQLVNSFGSWCSAGGSVLTGLCRRRMDEANLYLNGDYTRWSEAYSCLIFNGNGGKPDDKVEYFMPNAVVGTLPGASRSGYHLTGWYTNASGGLLFTTTSQAPSSGTMSLYAHWETGEPSTPPTTVPPTEPTEPTELTEPTEPSESTEVNTPTERFTDVSAEKWYYVPVMEAVDAGLFSGISKTEFAPDAPMTRAMLVTVLHRLDGEPTAQEAAPFTDMERGKWYTEAVDWAYENGVVKGMDDSFFGLNQNITREQLTTMLYRYAQYKDYDTQSRKELDDFSDAERISDYARDALCWAVAATIVDGDGGRLLPGGNATRAQCAKMMTVFLKQYK